MGMEYISRGLPPEKFQAIASKHNAGSGIIISEESFAYIHDNLIANNFSTGITCDHSNPIISNNQIIGGSVGVKIQNNARPNLGDLSNSDPQDNGGNTFADQTSKTIQNTTPLKRKTTIGEPTVPKTFRAKLKGQQTYILSSTFFLPSSNLSR